MSTCPSSGRSKLTHVKTEPVKEKRTKHVAKYHCRVIVESFQGRGKARNQINFKEFKKKIFFETEEMGINKNRYS